MKDSRKKMIAIALATMVMAAAICVYYAEEEDTEDSDAFVVLSGAYLGGIILGSFIAGLLTGLVIGSTMETGSNDDTTRTNEASTIAEETEIASSFYVNGLNNYSQLWGFTSEHFIRTSELAASYSWSADSTYDSATILSNSGTYYNSAYMMLNSTVEMNTYLNSISERMQQWQNYEVYDGNMEMNWTYGSNSFGSDSDWGGFIVSVANVSSTTTYDRTYIAGGTIYVFGGSATITSSDGTTISLSEGANSLDSITGFEPGVYTLQKGRQYAGSEIIPTVGDARSAVVYAGIVMESDGELRLGYYSNDRIIIDGVSYSDLNISCVPTGGGSSDSYGIISMLEAYDGLIDSIYETLRDANSSAHAVWNIFDEAGQACVYLTTLTVPDEYENVDMSTNQKQIMTTLSLMELEQYSDTSGGLLKTSGYDVSTESLSLFCRGDIYYYSGTEKIMLYDDVIFTPYYYVNDETLTLGEQQQTQFSICSIWADGQNLSGWSQTTDTMTDITSVNSGYYYDISEMYYDGASVTSQNLDVKQIDYIEAENIDTDPIEPTPSSDINWWAVLLIAVGIILAIAGYASGNDGIGKVGIFIFVLGVGWLLLDYLMDYIDSLSLFSTPFLRGGA